MAQYQQRLQADYRAPLETRVVPRIDGYVEGITAYTAVIGRYAQFCAQSGFTPSAGRAFVGSVTPAIDALTSGAQKLAPSPVGASRL